MFQGLLLCVSTRSEKRLCIRLWTLCIDSGGLLNGKRVYDILY